MREFKSTAKGADMIVVTKCPSELKKEEAQKIEDLLQHYCKQIFFATYTISKPNILRENPIKNKNYWEKYSKV